MTLAAASRLEGFIWGFLIGAATSMAVCMWVMWKHGLIVL